MSERRFVEANSRTMARVGSMLVTLVEICTDVNVFVDSLTNGNNFVRNVRNPLLEQIRRTTKCTARSRYVKLTDSFGGDGGGGGGDCGDGDGDDGDRW